VPVHVLRRLFSGKGAIVREALAAGVDRLSIAVRDDMAIGLRESMVLQRHLARLAKLFHENTEFNEALLMAAVRTGSDLEDAVEEIDLSKILVPVIESGQRSGEFRTIETPAQTARIVTYTLMLRCNDSLDNDPLSISEEMMSVVLNGIFAGKK